MFYFWVFSWSFFSKSFDFLWVSLLFLLGLPFELVFGRVLHGWRGFSRFSMDNFEGFLCEGFLGFPFVFCLRAFEGFLFLTSSVLMFFFRVF